MSREAFQLLRANVSVNGNPWDYTLKDDGGSRFCGSHATQHICMHAHPTNKTHTLHSKHAHTPTWCCADTEPRNRDLSAQLKAIQLEVYELITRVAQHRTATPKEIDEALAQAKLPPLPSEPADLEQQKDADAGTQQSGPSQPSREFCALVCVVCVVCVCVWGGVWFKRGVVAAFFDPPSCSFSPLPFFCTG